MEKSTKVIVKDSVLCQAAEAGMDEFIKVFTDAIYDFIGGELCADNMGMLNSDQITLLAYVILRDTVMDGGFIELIHNGYGGFIFKNPFGKAVREWGLQDLYKIIRKCHSLYGKHHEALEKDCTQEEFDALYEQYPMFSAIAHYIDEHIDNFATIVNE